MGRIIYSFLIFSFIFFQCKKDTESYSNGSSSNYTQGTYNHNLDAGSSAKDFLRSTIFKSLRIEIQYMPGFKPDSSAIEIFVDLLKERLNKPAGIFIELKEIDPTLKTIFTTSDISSIESQNRTVHTKGDQLGAYVLFISGEYYSGSILGLAYKNTSICLFGEPFKYFSIGIIDNAKAKIMAMLLEHEFGHLFGLVDAGTFMQVDHLDAENGSHCDNNTCLMHHGFETNTRDFVKDFADIPPFDTNCIADMKANGGK